MTPRLQPAAASGRLAAGVIVTNDAGFTSPTGAHFAAGERFEVEIVERSTRARHLGTGSVVWIQGSTAGARFVVAS